VRFRDEAVHREERYSIGVEEESGRFYVSIPVSNGLVDYEEYYEIDETLYERYRADLDSALELVERCRRRQADERLMYQPSSRRGSAL